MIQRKNALNDKNCYNGRNRLEFEIVSSRVTKYTVSYLGKLIKLARKERGFSQQELAERLHVSRSTTQRIEDGNTKVSIGNVFEACYILGIPLFGGDREHINNLSGMLSYMNKLLPESIPNKIIIDDDF